jgi:hypothetical protein
LNYHYNMPWRVRGVRFTFFLMPDVAVSPDTWRDVVGTDPDNVTQQRATGLRQEAGPFMESMASLTVLPGRVDLVFAPLENPETNFTTLGDFPPSAEPYITLISRWVRSGRFPGARRLAFGLNLIEPTESREAGYQHLRRFIGDAVPSGNASDFLYQVNRYRPSVAGVANLQVNRLAKWSVAQFQLFVVAAGGSPAFAPPLTFVNLELDVSTSADFPGPIPPDALGPVWDDVLSGATEIATQQDRVG